MLELPDVLAAPSPAGVETLALDTGAAVASAACTKCGAAGMTTTKAVLRTPPCLLARYGNANRLVSSAATLPLRFAVPPGWCSQGRPHGGLTAYTVAAAGVHHGSTAGGHYTAAVQWRGLWLRADDRTVSLRDSVGLRGVTMLAMASAEGPGH